MSSCKLSIRKEASWTIYNITAGNNDQIQQVIEQGLIPSLVELLAHASFDVKKEAAWAISNATSGGTPEQIMYLVSQQCIQPLCDLLAVKDSRIVKVALEGIENILKLGEDEKEKAGSEMNDMVSLVEEADGMEKLEQLQSHANDDIYQRAVKILESYFGEEGEEEDGELEPQLVEGGDQFQFGLGDGGGQAGGFNFGMQ